MLAVAVLAVGVAVLAILLQHRAPQPKPTPTPTPTPTTSACPADACVGIDATVDAGPAELRAQGFLHGVSNDAGGRPGAPPAPLLKPVMPRWWRVQISRDVADARVAGSHGAVVTALLSDAWKAAHIDGRGRTKTPWSDWKEYKSWVTGFVTATERQGVRIDYWDIQNEPRDLTYYAAEDQYSVTTRNLLQQFLAAYQAIKAADPSARVVGPSLDGFQEYPGEYPGTILDLRTFLDFWVEHGLKLDAVSWHELSTIRGETDTTNAPEAIVQHVARARALLQARPTLGKPLIFINEYGASSTHLVPGWMVGNIAALEEANVNQANHSCWGGVECFEPALDGLLTPDGTQTRAVYWVAAAYGAMTGRRVPVSTTQDGVTGFATFDPATSTVRLLLGRHVSCTARTNPYCEEPASATPGPVGVAVTIKIASSNRQQVTIARIPDVSGPLGLPQQVSTTTVTPTQGVVEVPIPAFADGDAYVITLSPTSS
jgi:hypothetical protein